MNIQKYEIQKNHIVSLLKYSGISFIAGAVNHGVFSQERSLITASIGAFLYILGSCLEHWGEAEESKAPVRVILVGLLASIGLGFFTGGLQHFPDSPERSAWVIPSGFVLSFIALYAMHPKRNVHTKHASAYLLLAGSLVFAACTWAAYCVTSAGSKSTSDAHTHSAPAEGKAATCECASHCDMLSGIKDSKQFDAMTKAMSERSSQSKSMGHQEKADEKMTACGCNMACGAMKSGISDKQKDSLDSLSQKSAVDTSFKNGMKPDEHKHQH